MTYEITKRELAPQPVLYIRRRIAHHDIARTLGEVIGRVFGYAQKEGIAFAGPPFTRYPEWGPGMITLEAGMQVVAAKGSGDIEAGTLPGGVAAMTVHAGHYDKLTEAHAAIERWIAVNGLKTGGEPWESYVTDPAEVPDVNDWRTEVYWPLAAS